jgi:hypothetical protein
MSALNRTCLTIEQKIKLGIDVFSGQEQHGTITQLSDEFGVSRHTVYDVKDTINNLINEHYDNNESASQQLVNVIADNTQIARAIVCLRCDMPASLRNIEDALPMLYTGINPPSFGTVQSITSEAERKAKKINEKTNLSKVVNVAMDEMFSQGDPVLAIVDLDSSLLVGLELREGRKGDDWAYILEKAKAQGLNLEIVVKDAGVGMTAGLNKIFSDAQQRDDCFHVLYDTNKIYRCIRARAYNAIAIEYDAKALLLKISPTEKEKYLEQEEKYLRLKNQANKKIEIYDEFAKAVKLIREAMEYVDIQTGELYTEKQVKSMMIEASEILKNIGGEQNTKLATYIYNRAEGISFAAKALSENLEILSLIHGEDKISCACLILRLAKKLKKNKTNHLYDPEYKYFLGLNAHLKSLMDGKNGHDRQKQVNQLLDDISELLNKRYRASSAIEGFNAALRPYLYKHKRATQGFLDLFKFHYNNHIRRSGCNKGISAIGCLTGIEEDWLTKLGYPPSSHNIH